MVKVKVCGITNLGDALAAAEAGCDALGFIFYRKSPRYITPVKAHAIITGLPPTMIKIGVFVNAHEKFIKHVAQFCRLDMLQFHGEETPEFCSKFKGYKIIKSFRVKPGKVVCSVSSKNRSSLKNVLEYNPFAYLFDTYSGVQAGGTGKKFDWRLVRHIDSLVRPVFLSGGLHPGNVLKAIKCVEPEWVDACSSLESSPGKKDHKKVKKFVETVKKSGY